jgi:hypothetical protein
MRAIDFTEMPATFEHAVLVTRRLAVEYLWIDSLCIIQDSNDDWAKESCRMQEVYANAIVNISADHASDSTVGLVSSGQLTPSLKVGSSKDGDDVYARPPCEYTDSFGVSHIPTPDWKPIEFVLDTRAWVVQERILSPRILHFSKYEIAWECDTHTLCECTVQPRESFGRALRKALMGALRDSYDVKLAWSALVGHYATMKLTFESDRLIAFAGLALKAASSWERTYIAGLWKEDLPYSLLWCIVQGPSHRLREHFPSWTWASVRGTTCSTRLGFYETKSDFDFRLRIIWYGDVEEWFEGIFDSEIKESIGRSTEIKETFSSQVEEEFHTRFLKLGVIWGRGWLAKINFNSKKKLISTSKAMGRTLLYPDSSDWSEFAIIPGKNLHLLIISTHQGFSENSIIYDKYYCLVLREADSSSRFEGCRTCYQRIGRYHYTVRSDSKNEFLTPFYEEEIYLV